MTGDGRNCIARVCPHPCMSTQFPYNFGVHTHNVGIQDRDLGLGLGLMG